MAIETLRPSANSAPDEWVLGAGSSKWNSCRTNDGATSYSVADCTLSAPIHLDDVQRFALDNPIVIDSNDVINFVTVRWVVQRVDEFIGDFTASLILGANRTDGTPTGVVDLFPVWGTFTQVLARPGGGAWSLADLIALEIEGKFHADVTAQFNCTELTIDVDYTPVGGGGSGGRDRDGLKLRNHGT